MKFPFFLLGSYILTVFISCQSHSKPGIENTIPTSEEIYGITTKDLEVIWEKLIEQQGCLTGGQYHKNGNFGNEGNIMSNSQEWKSFLNQRKDSLTHFLVAKMDKIDTTAIHTCPFFLATEGEIAVYTLQRIHNKNWFEYDAFQEYEIRFSNPPEPPIGNDFNFQAWLNKEILQNPTKRKVLQNLFLSELN